MANETLVLTTPVQISNARKLCLWGALKLECKGMRHSRGVSAYMIVKTRYSLTGSRAVVLAHYEAILRAEGVLSDSAAPPGPAPATSSGSTRSRP